MIDEFEAVEDSVKPMEDSFFDIVGTAMPMRVTDHIRTKTPEAIRELIAGVKRRSGSNVARP